MNHMKGRGAGGSSERAIKSEEQTAQGQAHDWGAAAGCAFSRICCAAETSPSSPLLPASRARRACRARASSALSRGSASSRSYAAIWEKPSAQLICTA